MRYALAQLRNRNEHHRFEHLCESLARQRITPNIVSGTGPVSAGGDQGRDFETFTGYTHGHVRSLGSELGIADRQTIVFCCTVGHSDLSAKIRTDLQAVADEGEPVDVVVYFCEQDVPTAKRHQLQDAALADHDIKLIILDGQTLTSLLCDRDTFWVAVEFLDVPSRFAPADAGPRWYQETRSRWLARSTAASSTGDCVELATSIRFATYNSEHRGDIPMWLDRLRPLRSNDIDVTLRNRARYEVVVAQYRGLGELRPADPVVRDLLTDAASSVSAALLESALVVLDYASGAWVYALTDLSAEELAIYGRQIEQHLVELAESADTIDGRCRCLSLVGKARLRMDMSALVLEGPRLAGFDPPPIMTADQWHAFLADNRVTEDSSRRPLSDPVGAVAAWTDAATILNESPLFPVQSFASTVAFYAGDLHDVSGWSELTEVVDEPSPRRQAADRVHLSVGHVLGACSSPTSPSPHWTNSTRPASPSCRMMLETTVRKSSLTRRARTPTSACSTQRNTMHSLLGPWRDPTEEATILSSPAA